MSILLHGDCLEEMKGLDDNSVDLIFCDLPYGQTSCKWDCCIDLEKFWIEVMRIKKLNTAIFMTTTTKFGVSLINSAPKKCPFRYDIVWVKSAPAGFLSAKKMPMRKHEMIYVFYEKLPFYDLSSHKHKFLKPNTPMGNKPVSVVRELHTNNNGNKGGLYGKGKLVKYKEIKGGGYEPPLPVSVVKEELTGGATGEEKDADCYNFTNRLNNGKLRNLDKEFYIGRNGGTAYEPPLPVSVVKEGEMIKDFTPNKNGNIYDCPDNQEFAGRNGEARYEPPLPVSVVKEQTGGATMGECYGNIDRSLEQYKECGKRGKNQILYDPPLPVSVVKEEIMDSEIYGELPTTDSYVESIGMKKADKHKVHYDPPLPTTMLEIKSTRGKHSTEKPVALMEWVLKYYSKEGDVVLDPTMGSGSTGVACKNMNRNFIGIELDDEIYEVAVNRIEE